MSTLWGYASELIIKYGYFGLYLSLLAEGTGLPLPVQLLFMAAAYFVKIKKMSLINVIIIATAGNLSGNILAYYLVYYGGRPIIKRLNIFLKIKDEDIYKIKNWFNRYGGLTNMVSRWIGITRTPAIWAAGLFRIDFFSYVLFSLIGDFLWAVFWIVFYIKMYDNMRLLLGLPLEYKLVAVAVFLIFIFLAWDIFLKYFRKGHAG
ncbi:DedA family protein [Thermoanaerobacterium sp. DL9XJH110]|uniref:DedA family protein n=1 Tax=Thermoanaerobacterium sp. DL9XJH110 TaxID=3386643 RepID=UPI003BB709C9